jgi:DNA-binding transcriptional ArsR family regulator
MSIYKCFRNPQSKNFTYLLLNQIRSGFSPVKIALNFGISKQSLQYHLNKLKHAGLIRKIGYGTWEVVDDEFSAKNGSKKTLRVAVDNPQQSNLNFFTQDATRGHAFVFTLRKIIGATCQYCIEYRCK